jgi:hypothetical protein
MSGNQDFIAPIMTKGSNTYQFGNNAYGKPATALNILRETVMGHELFDYAFKEYARRWKFKHPTPEDFFRTMEDASAFDLDWFWRGWFYTTDWVDIGVKDVKRYFVTSQPNAYIRAYLKEHGITQKQLKPLVCTVEEGSEDFKKSMLKQKVADVETLKSYIMDNFSAEEQSAIKVPQYFYNVTFEKPGGLVMPIIVEYTYKDGSKLKETYPAEIWRLNDKEVSKVIASDKEIVSIQIDAKLETADVNVENNVWPRREVKSEFERFKSTNKN